MKRNAKETKKRKKEWVVTHEICKASRHYIFHSQIACVICQTTIIGLYDLFHDFYLQVIHTCFLIGLVCPHTCNCTETTISWMQIVDPPPPHSSCLSNQIDWICGVTKDNNIVQIQSLISTLYRNSLTCEFLTSSQNSEKPIMGEEEIRDTLRFWLLYTNPEHE